MDKVYIESALRPEGHYSPAVSDGKYIYVSGQLPIDPFTGEACRGGVAEQTRRVLENIRLVLPGQREAVRRRCSEARFMSQISATGTRSTAYTPSFSAHTGRPEA